MCLNFKRFILLAVFIIFGVNAGFSAKPCNAEPIIDANYPGGNIIVYKLNGRIVDGNTVYLQQDLRDTQWWWFYWNFRVQAAQGRTLNFKFCLKHPKLGISPFGTQGPAVSTDGGQSWSWLGADSVKDDTFTYSFPKDGKEVRFCFTIPYLQKDLDKFINLYRGNPAFSVKRLCKTAKGRIVPRIYAGKLKGEPKYRILLTARHHACESIADFVMEGILESAMADTSDGKWFRENVEILAIPFVDKDGVEDGDQGKLRRPHDHGYDYGDKSIYPSVAAIKKLVPKWSDNKLRIAMDIHCPYLGREIYFTECQVKDYEKYNQKFRQIFKEVQTGPLIWYGKYQTVVQGNYEPTFPNWVSSLSGIQVSTVIEVPYANVGDAVVTAESARLLGNDLACAMKEYLCEQ